MLLVILGCHNKIPQTGLNQRFIFSQPWRLAVHDQGNGMAGFCQELSSWLADSHFLPWWKERGFWSLFLL